jgi:hypothetical protein
VSATAKTKTILERAVCGTLAWLIGSFLKMVLLIEFLRRVMPDNPTAQTAVAVFSFAGVLVIAPRSKQAERIIRWYFRHLGLVARAIRQRANRRRPPRR